MTIAKQATDVDIVRWAMVRALLLHQDTVDRETISAAVLEASPKQLMAILQIDNTALANRASKAFRKKEQAGR